MRLLDWNHVLADYHSLLCTRRSIHHAGGLRCYTYMSDESKRGHVALTFQNFKRFSVETRLQASKETKSLDIFTGWVECEYLIMPSPHVENISIHNQTVIQYSECKFKE